MINIYISEDDQRGIHPDVVEDLREEARLNVRALIASGDVAPVDADEAFEIELERMLQDHMERLKSA
jgi:hypothetical protein